MKVDRAIVMSLVELNPEHEYDIHMPPATLQQLAAEREPYPVFPLGVEMVWGCPVVYNAQMAAGSFALVRRPK